MQFSPSEGHIVSSDSTFQGKLHSPAENELNLFSNCSSNIDRKRKSTNIENKYPLI